MDLIQKNLLSQIADLHEVPEGAYNIRANGVSAGQNTTANIDIVQKEDKDGIDIVIKPEISIDTFLHTFYTRISIGTRRNCNHRINLWIFLK